MIQKSPFTGGNVRMITENRDFLFKGEKVTVPFSYYLCEDTQERFTTTELDEKNLEKLHEQYSLKLHSQYSVC